jgi:glycosyltransferase involved in cell wall biosynthesis
MPLVSVVIPALNEESQLPRTLATLKNQDIEAEYEIVVVDNGSTDGTVELARKSGARVVFSPDRGVANARQVGLESARGHILVQADADTEYPVDWLSNIVRIFKANHDVVAVAGSFNYREPKKFERAEWMMRDSANRGSMVCTGRLLMISGANFSYYRKALERCGGYRHKAFSPDQYDVAARLSAVGRIVYDRRLQVTTSARRVQRPAVMIAMILLRFVMGLHLNIFKFFFVDQFREWVPLTRYCSSYTKALNTSAIILLPCVTILIAIWIYFSAFGTIPVFGIEIP